MLGARWYKVLYDLWGNKTRTTLIVLSITAGLFAIGMIVNTRVIMSEEMDRGYAAINPSHGTVQTIEPFYQDFVESVRRMDGVAEADFLSSRIPGISLIRATSGGLISELEIETSLVDPNAPGGSITNYPNPFHPGEIATTIAYKLSDNANVTLRIYTLSGSLVLREDFARGEHGGVVGLNEYEWDGRNGKGDYVSSGGYIVVVEAEGKGETLHVMRRRVAVVR